MDLVTLTIFLICFLVVCGLVGLISYLGTKEQSYEDGLKASRQMASKLSNKEGGKDKSASGGGRKAKAGKASATATSGKDQSASTKTSGSTKLTKDESDDRVVTSSSSDAGTPEPTKPEEEPAAIVEEPIVQEVQVGLHMTAAGKTKAAKQKKAAAKAAPAAPAAEDVVDDVAAQIEPVAPTAPAPAAAADQRMPANEPIIVKEEAVLLYDDKVESVGTQQSTPSGGSGGKQKKKRGGGASKDSAPASPGKSVATTAVKQQPADLMSAVKKTHFDEEELQNLIEVLLNKQQNNGPSLNGSWVEPQPSEVKQLQKALQERELQLDEEQGRVKALSERYQQMQRELAESKGQLGQMQRVHADFQNQINGLEMAKREAEQNFRNLSQHSSYEIQNLSHQKDQFALQVSELQMMIRSRSSADDEIKAELEAAKAAHASEVNNLHSQINHRSSEINQLKQQMDQLRGQLESSEGQKEVMSQELNKANNHSKDLESKVNAMQEDNTKVNTEKQAELQSKIEELVKSQAGLESNLNGVTCQLRAKEKEVVSLADSKSQLADQLAKAEERLKVAVEEAAAVAANGHAKDHEEEEAAAARILDFEAKLKQVHLEKGKMEEEICQLKSGAQKEVESLKADIEKVKIESETYRKEAAIVGDLQSQVESAKLELQEANSTLAQQRVKNDELRARNWKVVDALKKAEDGLAKAKQSPAHSSFSALEVEKSTQSQLNAKYGEFLQRLLPDIELSGGWQAGLESQVKTLKESAEAAAASLSSTAAAANQEGEEEEEKRQVLEKQVVHYKNSLQETESLLHNLQASVEAEEAKWKQSLAEQQQELEALKQQNAKMETCVQSAEEMQEKLHQLQAKLVGHEEAKKDLEKSMAEKDDFQSEEKQRLMKEIESLKDGKSELGLQVARMNQLVTAGQEALQQEQKTVDLLREQLAKANVTSSKGEEIVVGSAAPVVAANNEVEASS